MPGSRKKVLWVDDEIEFLRSHIMFLETRGYSVIPVFSGDDATELLKEKRDDFDIVLLDEQMPGKDGLTTLVEIKEMLPDLPVVMVTKSEEEQVMEEALGRKIDGYLTKPVNPSQILSVCKRLLDSKEIISSQVTQRFVRHYSENRSLLAGAMSVNDWIRLYDNLTYWDFELDSVDDEGLRQNHAGQKSDCNVVFGQFLVERYPQWIKGESNPPLLAKDVAAAHVRPLLDKDERVCFLVLDCMRLDQFWTMQSLLGKHFEIERHSSFSLLPTGTVFSRTALLSGMLPIDAVEAYPELAERLDNDDRSVTGRENEMLVNNLAAQGLDISDSCGFFSVTDSSDAHRLLEIIKEKQELRLLGVLVNFVDMLTQGRSDLSILQDIAPDESAYRALTNSWFQYSMLLQILRELAHQGMTVVLTADHGTILCSRGTEVYGTRDLHPDLRYRFGEKITCDERHALFLSSPEHFGLPAATADTACIIAKENYYLTRPEKFAEYHEHYRSAFNYGGISLEEVIVPVAVMRGKREG